MALAAAVLIAYGLVEGLAALAIPLLAVLLVYGFSGYTSTGLSLVVRPVLVLQAPGVVENYQQLDRARTAMGDTFRSQFRHE